MTTRNESPSTPTDDLPRVDPPARVSRPVRACAAFLANWRRPVLAKNIAPSANPWLLRAIGADWPRESSCLRHCSTGVKAGQPRTNPAFYFHRRAT